MHSAKARAKAKESKDSKVSTDRKGTRARTRTRIRLMLELWKARTLLERLLEQEEHQQRWFEGENTNPRMPMLTILTRNHQMLIIEFNMSYLDGDALQQQESERMMVQDWSRHRCRQDDMAQSITYGKTNVGDSDLTFRTATGKIVKGGKQMHVEGCDDWGVNLRGVQAPVCKPLLSVGEYTTMGGVTVLYGDKGYLFHKGSNVAKKIDAWTQKELRDSQYRGCTVAYKENNVYNIYMKPRDNKIVAMPLSGDSESGGCRPGPNL